MDTKRKVEESIALLNSLFAHPTKKLATDKQTLENTTTGVVSSSTAVARDATQPAALENIKKRSFLPPRPAVLDKLSRLAASRPTLQDSIAASIAASAPTVHVVATSPTSLDPSASTTVTTTSTISSLTTKSGSFKSDKKRYLPWSRDQFHERLETFKPSTWFDKPKLVNAVECAKRGWINKGSDRLECYGGCGGVVIVAFDEMRDFSTQTAPTTSTESEGGGKDDSIVTVDEGCNMDEDQLIPELDTEALGPKFHAMLTENHASSCPWRSHPCDDSIYKFPVVPLSQANQELLDRITHLKNMANDPLIDKIRHPLSSKQVVDLTHILPELMETKLAILSLFGWTAAENQKVLSCPACHTQCTFVPSYGSNADQLDSQKGNDTIEDDFDETAFDVVQAHKWYCYWVDPKQLQGNKEGWRILYGMLTSACKANTEVGNQQTGDSSTETPAVPIVARMEPRDAVAQIRRMLRGQEVGSA